VGDSHPDKMQNIITVSVADLDPRKVFP
jgi:hypothetical protein